MKAAIIGAGNIADFHAMAYLAEDDLVLCAICDIEEAKARVLSYKYNCKWYTDAYLMLLSEKPDVISICLPTFLHKKYCIMALEAGANVLCEKPLSLSIDECLEMIKVSKQTRKQLMTGQVLRWWPEYLKIAENIKRMGRPNYIQAKRLQHPSRISWHMQPKLGGGVLFDLFVHDIDYICSLLGTNVDTISVNGNKGAEGSWRRIDAMLCWSNGCCAQIESNNMMPVGYPFTSMLHVEYDDSCIDYKFCTPINIKRGAAEKSELLLYENNNRVNYSLNKNSQEEAFTAEIHAFVQGIKKEKPAFPIEETLEVMKIIYRIKSILDKQDYTKY